MGVKIPGEKRYVTLEWPLTKSNRKPYKQNLSNWLTSRLSSRYYGAIQSTYQVLRNAGGGVGGSFPRKKRYKGNGSTLLALRGGGGKISREKAIRNT